MKGLFEDPASAPLADRLRPRSLGDVVGQDHLLGPSGPIGRLVAAGRLVSMILWGPAGCGKTTVARLLADHTRHHFEPLSAVFSGVADLRRIFEQAKKRRQLGEGTVLFIDEIHRYNRGQQDAFLPFVEDGTVTLIGATTENPSFELVAPLLSRAQVMVFRRLDADALATLLGRAEAALGTTLPLNAEARLSLLAMADGDGRYLLNMVEGIADLPAAPLLDATDLAAAVQRRRPIHDKSQEGHYNLISALHKALRGSDPDAGLYWLARMLAGGDDPRYIARRLVRFAVEDIGLADPGALTQALNAWEAYERLGSPEGELALVCCVIYLGTAPKSNAAYRAAGAAMRAAKATGSLMPPMKSLNAPTRLMRDLGYGADYAYDHDADDAFAGQNHFPDGMERVTFYRPSDRGLEKRIGERLAEWARLRREREGS